MFVFVCLLHSLSALSGVTPTNYGVDYKPNLEGSYSFTFLFDDDVKADIITQGALAKFIRLDKKSLTGTDTVTAYLKLPEEAGKPGNNIIRVTAKQRPPEGASVALVAEVAGLINIKVPYPGKYIETSVASSNVNLGENVSINISVSNKGKDDVYIVPELDIYNGEELFKKISFENVFLKSTESIMLSKEVSTESWKAGDYNLNATIYYGAEEPAHAYSLLRIGTLLVKITNYTKEFEKEKINRFEIKTQSFWNSEIKDVYVEVRILGTNIEFNTPSADIGPWGENVFTGFFDTSEIKDKNFQADIILHYADKNPRTRINLGLYSRINYWMIGLIFAGLIILILFVIIIILIRKNGKKNKRK